MMALANIRGHSVAAPIGRRNLVSPLSIVRPGQALDAEITSCGGAPLRAWQSGTVEQESTLAVSHAADSVMGPVHRRQYRWRGSARFSWETDFVSCGASLIRKSP